MGTTELQQELHQFINLADERLLRLMYGMMKADVEDESSFLLPDAHKQNLLLPIAKMRSERSHQ